MNSPPAPLVPGDCDLTDFSFLPLDVRRLRDSKLAASATGDEFRAAVMLWCASWHQKPAASLPDDDVELSALAGYGRVQREWKKVRKGALYGWIKCSDGRFYHPIVAEKAIEAWNEKIDHRWSRECDRLRKENKRLESVGKLPLEFPPRPPRISGGAADGKTNISAGIPAENALKGQGQGQGQGKIPPVTPLAAVDASPPASPPAPVPPDRGIRLPDQWQPDSEDWDFAVSLGLAPAEVGPKFRDHYVAQPGVRGRRAGMKGWQATFRNWCREQVERDARNPSARPVRGGAPPPDRLDWLSREFRAMHPPEDQAPVFEHGPLDPRARHFAKEPSA